MANIKMKNITKVYPGDVTAVHEFNLDIADTEFVVLVGPSGCGKSTTLRMIAGLEEITGGELYINDKLVNDVPPKDRDIAMVFQNYALYPHMTVYKNMAFSLQLRKMDKDIIDQKVNEAAEILGIEELLNRKPKALSGGQRQRVALGRAMVRDPAVFLLDEPLSNLDAKLRTTMRSEITKLHKRLKESGTTFVYVTHDQVEAMTMADRIVVMKDGWLQQVDTPQNLYDTPCNMFVAGFIGSPQMNFFNCVLEKRDNGFVAVYDGKDIVIPAGKIAPEALAEFEGREVVLGIRAENLRIEEVYQDMETSSQIDVDVDIAEMMGSEIFLYGSVGETKIIAKLPPRHHFEEGERVTLAIDGNHIHLFNKLTEDRIG